MRKVSYTIAFFFILTVVFLQYGYTPLSNLLGLKSKAGVWLDSNRTAEVLIDGKSVGTTPFKDINLKEGDHQIEIKDASSAAGWRSEVSLNGGTLTVINRDLDQDQTKAAGEVIRVEKGQGITISSIPGGAKIQVDGQDKGTTPLFLPNLAVGDHLFLLRKDNFVNRTVKAKVNEGFGLNILVDLAQQEAEVVPSPAPIQTATKLKVLSTPTGFLRVRETPSTAGKEIIRVSPGDELTLIEETNSSWDKISTTDGKEGYVSSAYVSKQ